MKRLAILMVAAGTLAIAACGSESSKPTATGPLSKEQGCAEARVIQTDSQKLTDDLKAGKADMGRMMKEMGSNATRLEAVAGRMQPGEVQAAVKQWATTSKAQLEDASKANQTATFDARDRVDDLCGIPRGSRL